MANATEAKARHELEAEATRPAHPMDELAQVKVQYAQLSQQYAELARQLLETVQRGETGVAFLPPEETPVYEVGEGGYYSPDDILYPPGAQFEDVTGLIVPNDSMIPLNAAAEQRIKLYLSTLPLGTKTPPLDVIIQAAWEALPKPGEDPATIARNKANVIQRALELHYAQIGIRGEDIPQRQTTVSRKPTNVPLMSNTKITGVPQAQRPRAFTRLHAEPVPAALKSAPVMGTVASQPLGQRMQGVTVP